MHTKILGVITLVCGVASAFAKEYILAGILIVITVGLFWPKGKST